LQDLNSQESKDEASLAKMKKQLRDMEAKIKDQEEELDEQAGTIQILEQAKLRLEMEMERLRQTHFKEVESKDDEVEEIRQSCSKKVREIIVFIFNNIISCLRVGGNLLLVAREG
ncbi:Unconventional myosin-XVIIIa, partial [Goodea atripinnis]